ALAAQHVALRMRKEGARWVQTAKAQGDDPTVRLEHNVLLGRASRARALPTVDPARHRGTPVGQRLDQALSRSGAPAALLARYRTDILRLSRERRRPGARLELAFDEGRISAGLPPGATRLKPTTPRFLSLCELEIECLSGSSAAVFDEAGEWIEQHGLWLDTRSKALRGERLALGGAAAPRAARALTFSAGASLELAWVELHRSALSTVLDNASDLAAGLHSVEHVHQLRVGLNRLRAAWRLFEDSAWSPPAPLADAVQHVFHVLGRHRDRSIWARWRERMRQPLGQDLVRQLPALPHAPAQEDPLALLRSPAVNLAWLQWLRLCAAQGRDASKAAP
ncbi:MAG: CHAD domain-containing protein, partial [Rhizobacter sp.]